MTEIEFISHTADAGFIVRDKDVRKVVEGCIFALFDTIFRGGFEIAREQIKRRISKTIEIQTETLDVCLVSLLEELLFLFETKRLVPTAIRKIDVEDTRLALDIEFGEYCGSKELVEVKAITYHNLEFKRVGDVWKAQIIVDL